MCLCGRGLQPGAALVVVRLAVVTLKTLSTEPPVAGCFLVGCSVVRGLPLRSRAVVGVSQPFCIGLVPAVDHSLELYGWGDNAVRQLGLPSSQPGEPNTHHVLSTTRIPFDCQLL